MKDKLYGIWRRIKPNPSIDFNKATDEDVYYCYRLLLNREPDELGLAYWSDLVNHYEVPLQFVVDGFVHSHEFKALQAERNRPELIKLPDFKMYVRANDFFVGATIARERQYESYVARELRQLLSPGTTFVDIGANIGYFSLLAAVLINPQGRVIAFEPKPDNCELLRLSIAENDFDNIEVHIKAVADKAGTLSFSSGGADSNGRIMNDSEVASQPFPLPTVEAVTLDEALGDLDHIDVVKMDIEGAEPRALEGMGEIIKKHRPIIITEFSPELIKVTSCVAPESFLASLQEHYHLHILNRFTEKSREPQSIQDIMKAQAESGMTHLDLVAYPC